MHEFDNCLFIFTAASAGLVQLLGLNDLQIFRAPSRSFNRKHCLCNLFPYGDTDISSVSQTVVHETPSFPADVQGSPHTGKRFVTMSAVIHSRSKKRTFRRKVRYT